MLMNRNVNFDPAKRTLPGLILLSKNRSRIKPRPFYLHPSKRDFSVSKPCGIRQTSDVESGKNRGVHSFHVGFPYARRILHSDCQTSPYDSFPLKRRYHLDSELRCSTRFSFVNFSCPPVLIIHFTFGKFSPLPFCCFPKVPSPSLSAELLHGTPVNPPEPSVE